jgi:hypothetical protein
MSRPPRDATALNPRRPWLGVIAALVLFAVIALLIACSFLVGGRNQRASAVLGEWRLPGAAAATDLSIGPVGGAGSGSLELATGELEITGTLDGRPVSAALVLPRFPPWGSTFETTLLDESWTLEHDEARNTLTLASNAGRVLTLVPSR